MKKIGRYSIFIILLFVMEDIVLLNLLYFGLLYIFDFGYDTSYSLLQVIINLGYLLSTTIIQFHADVHKLRIRNIIRTNIRRLFITAVILLICLFATKISDTISRLYVFTFFIAAFVLLSVSHFITRKALTLTMIINNGHSVKAIILGAGFIGKKICEELRNNIYLGIKVLGFFDDNPAKNDGNILGNIEQVKEYVKANHVTKIYCTLPFSCNDKIMDILNFAQHNMINFHIAPPMEYCYANNFAVESIGNVLIFTTQKIPLDYFHNILIKRIFDIVVSFVLLVTVFPVIYLILGIIIKISSPGPVFFLQERTGKNGATFKCYKFRSMQVNDEANTKQATANDPRTTRVGKFIRHTNLDELPQFINVLKGDMSIVGPRPHPLVLTDKYSQLVNKYMVRHFIKPGVTGWAQINGCRGETKEVSQMEDRIRKDIWYLENWSFLLDIEIIIRTSTNSRNSSTYSRAICR
ncbi:MAG: undecaprenyl-phosphate glucose phosphotransferase [Prevotellaceae bacterium]|jgi:putative colanic acid biosynthesis UDP-glucose lipid carrier transferase|nr:undecaprenyl-phosphate glucose phosphotransferase [Prevotellaceae bacterium]